MRISLRDDDHGDHPFARGIGWGWSDVLDTANLHAGTGESAESGLSTWAWGLGAVATSSSDLDMQSGNAQLLAADSDILRSQHSSVRRGLVTVSLDLHATRHTGNGLAAAEIGDMDEGIVEA